MAKQAIKSSQEICKFPEMLAMTKREVLLSFLRLDDNIKPKKRLLVIAITLISFECHGRFDFRSIFVFEKLNYL